MGVYRLILALAVVLSHISDAAIFGHAPGVVAVISFYLISGYVMTILIYRYYAALERIPEFYLDRAFRLFPQFLFYLVSTVALLAIFGIAPRPAAECTADLVALNAAILPLGYMWFYPPLKECLILPASWTLGLEMTFYLVAPVILIWLRKISGALSLVVAASALVAILAYIGAINTDVYGYRLLPGTLIIFLVGASFADEKLFGRKFPWIVWGCAIFLYALLWGVPAYMKRMYNKEVLLGAIIGIPMLALLIRYRFSKLDEFFGNLSYGVFLNHFFCIWALGLIGVQMAGAWQRVSLIVMSMVLAAVSYQLIERPAMQWRKSIRYQDRPVQIAAE